MEMIGSYYKGIAGVLTRPGLACYPKKMEKENKISSYINRVCVFVYVCAKVNISDKA